MSSTRSLRKSYIYLIVAILWTPLLNQDPVGDMEVTNLAVICASVLVSLPICNFRTVNYFFLLTA